MFRKIAVSLALGLVVPVVTAGAAEVTISASPNPVTAGDTVTFTFSPAVLVDGDSMTVAFGDGSTGTVEYIVGCRIIGGCNTITHSYAGAGVFEVTAHGTIAGDEVSGTTEVTVTELAAGNVAYVATAAHLPGFNQTTWRTDLTVHNTGNVQATFQISMLLRDQANTAAEPITFTLLPRRSAYFPDILAAQFGVQRGAAALRITTVQGSVAATSRTYNALADGSYGQFVPGEAENRGITPTRQGRFFGLFHNASQNTGFRCNLGLLNISPAPIQLSADFYNGNGTFLGDLTWQLEAYEYIQEDRVFGLVTTDTVDNGTIVLHEETTGGRALAYVAMVDNVTNDPIFIPATLVDVAP